MITVIDMLGSWAGMLTCCEVVQNCERRASSVKQQLWPVTGQARGAHLLGLSQEADAHLEWVDCNVCD